MGTKSTFSKREAINFGWNTMKANFWFFFALWLVVAAVKLVPSLIQGTVENNIGTVLIFSILSWIISIIVSMGFLKINLEFVARRKPKYANLFYYKPFINYSIGSIILVLITGIGFLFLIIPGIIFAIKLQFIPYLIIDKNLGPIEALRKSWEMTKGVEWNLFLFGSLVLLINLVGVLALLIGLFVTAPIAMVATAYVYRKLQTQLESK